MRKPKVVFTVACLSLLIVVSPEALASMTTVTNVSDNGPGSLRHALAHATDGDLIQFDPALDGMPIILTGGELVVDRDVTIAGRGAGATIIDAAWGSRVMRVDGVTVKIRRVTLRNGFDVHGAGLLNLEGTVTVEDSTVTECYAWDPALGSNGGGFHNYRGTLNLRNSTVSHNYAEVKGGGISNWSGQLNVVQSTISDNEALLGGGIHSLFGGVTIENGTVMYNSAVAEGGGLHLYSGGLTLRNGTVSGNSAGHAGGVFGYGASIFMENSLVASQASGGNCGIEWFPVYSLGHNLDSDGSCGLFAPTDLRHVDPMLLPPADNCGPTHTCALHPDSPAIDAGDTYCGRTDQRGFPRPVDGNGDLVARCDIGAFEYAPFTGQLIGILQDLILTLSGGDHDLVEPLQEALALLSQGVDGHGAVVDRLLAFVDEVECRRGVSLDLDEADRLIAEASRIIALMSSGRYSARDR